MIATATVTRTASGREQALVDFYRQLGRDGHTVTSLAEAARVGRAHLERVLNGHLSGRHTWKHVLPLLSEAALCHLKRCSTWNEYAGQALAIHGARRLPFIPFRARINLDTDFGQVAVSCRSAQDPTASTFTQ